MNTKLFVFLNNYLYLRMSVNAKTSIVDNWEEIDRVLSPNSIFHEYYYIEDGIVPRLIILIQYGKLAEFIRKLKPKLLKVKGIDPEFFARFAIKRLYSMCSVRKHRQ